jgi:hypothetical protein
VWPSFFLCSKGRTQLSVGSPGCERHFPLHEKTGPKLRAVSNCLRGILTTKEQIMDGW